MVVFNARAFKSSLAELSDVELRKAASVILSEITDRSVENGDPEASVQQAMQKGFRPDGSPNDPFVIGMHLAIPGILTEGSGKRHTCKLSTVTLPDDSLTMWVWDDQLPTFLTSDSDKIGSQMRSVALHTLIDGIVITRHSMSWDGERHTRNSSRSWTYSSEEGLTLTPDFVPGHLPPPHHERGKS